MALTPQSVVFDFAALHDERDVLALPQQAGQVPIWVAVHQQHIGQRARLDAAKLAHLVQHFGCRGGGALNHFLGRKHFVADTEFVALQALRGPSRSEP